MSYRNLEIWKEAREVSIAIHEMSLRLPRFEQFEQAQQIRRSSKSIRSNIVEGYGRRRYKADYIRFLIIAQASTDETTDHLETLFETRSLSDQQIFDDLHARLQRLGKKINNFIKSVEGDSPGGSVNETELGYGVDQQPATSDQPLFTESPSRV
jgi:four helix bundle protein